MLVELERSISSTAVASWWGRAGGVSEVADTGRTRIAFRIFAAMGYERGRAKVWRLEVFTSKSQPDWEAFLGALPGAPSRAVCDNDHGLTNAVGACFPDAELYLCEWHLRHALERLMAKLRREQPGHQEAIDELLRTSRRRSPARRSGRRSSSAATPPERVAGQHQADRRGPVRPPRTARQPAAGHAVEHLAAGRVHQPDPRRDRAARVRERTNRRLMLMQLHANRQDDERRCPSHPRLT